VVYSVVRPADDSENLKIVEFKRLSPHRESIRCLINVAGLSIDELNKLTSSQLIKSKLNTHGLIWLFSIFLGHL